LSVKEFLDKKNKIALVGVSTNPEKWGYKLFKLLKSEGYRVFPVNPKYEKIEGEKCHPSLSSLPEKPDVVITLVKPEVTEKIVEECSKLGIRRVWMQPGSESEKAIDFCKEKGIEVVFNACFVVNGLRGEWK